MLQLTFMIIILLIATIIFIAIKTKKNNSDFQEKINFLKNIIVDLTTELNSQSEMVKLSEELKSNLRQSNDVLSSKILDLNQDLFAGLFSKNNDGTK